MAGIIWLASYPKSGNTWTRAFIANYLVDGDEPLSINELQNYIYSDNAIVHYEKLAGKTIDHISRQEIAAIRPRIHNWIAQSRPTNVFVKTHSMITVADGAPLITPTATAAAIYIVRNPLDVAVSFAHHYQISVAAAVAALCEAQNCIPRGELQIEQYLSHWSRHVRSWLDAPGLIRHSIRYEDLLADPQGTFASIIEFLGLPLDRDRLDRAVRFSSFHELKSQEASQGFVEARNDGSTSFFRSGSKSDWRRSLDDHLVQTIIETHKQTMTELGYLSPAGDLVDI